MTRIQSNLKFSQEANKNIKNDYDSLQDKFDRNMKSTNNLNMDLKDEIEGLNVELGKLRIFKDDHDELIKDMKRKMEKELKEATEGKDEELANAVKERDAAVKEVKEMKSNYNKQMNQVKLLEMELEAKIAAQEQAEFNAYVPSSSEENEESEQE